MLDIEKLLIPNIITILVQLSATGVIFLLYRKYLHNPVLNILDKKAADFQSAYKEIEAMNQQQILDRENFEADRASQKETLERSKAMMLKDIEDMRDQLLAETRAEVERLKKNATDSIQREKESMLKEVENEIVNVAYVMTEKVLEGYRFDEQEMLNALTKEMDKTHARS